MNLCNLYIDNWTNEPLQKPSMLFCRTCKSALCIYPASTSRHSKRDVHDLDDTIVVVKGVVDDCFKKIEIIIQ